MKIFKVCHTEDSMNKVKNTISYVLIIMISVLLPLGEVYAACALGTCIDGRPSGGGGGGGDSDNGGQQRNTGPSNYQLRIEAENRVIDENNRLNQLGWDAYHSGDHLTALKYFQQAVDGDQGNFKPFQDAVRMARSAIANDSGRAAFDRGDFATALSYFQQALALYPHDIYRGQVHLAQERLKLQQDNRIAANNMEKIVRDYSQVSTPAHLTGALDFNSFNAAADAPAGQGTEKGIFGTHVAKPDNLVPKVSPGTVGHDTKAGDQLKSAAAVAPAGPLANLTPNYDGGTAKNAGSLVYTRSHSVDLSTFSEAARSDPQIVSAVKELDDLQIKRFQLETERDALIQKRDHAPDAATMKKLDEEAQSKDRAFQANLTAIAKKEVVVEIRRRYVDATVGGSTGQTDSKAAK
jgi:tetratricopeptide (TPR) repeat protein